MPLILRAKEVTERKTRRKILLKLPEELRNLISQMLRTDRKEPASATYLVMPFSRRMLEYVRADARTTQEIRVAMTYFYVITHDSLVH